MVTAELNAAIRANPSSPLKIQKMLAHGSLPLIALVYQDVEVDDKDRTACSLIEVYKLSP